VAETKFERIEIDLPRDVIFAMRQLQKPEEVKRKIKVALALFLFQERTISLGKAVELSEMSRVKFMEVLKDHDIPVYEYYERDLQLAPDGEKLVSIPGYISKERLMEKPGILERKNVYIPRSSELL